MKPPMKPPNDFDPDGSADIDEQIEALQNDHLFLRDRISDLFRAVERLERHIADRQKTRQTVKDVKRLVRSIGDAGDDELASYLNDGWTIQSDHVQDNKSYTLLIRERVSAPSPVTPTSTDELKRREWTTVRTTYAPVVQQVTSPTPLSSLSTQSHARTVTGTVMPVVEATQSEETFAEAMARGVRGDEIRSLGDWRASWEWEKAQLRAQCEAQRDDAAVQARKRHNRLNSYRHHVEKRAADGKGSVFTSLVERMESDERL